MRLGERISKMVGVALIEDKLREYSRSWVLHVWRKPIDATMKESNKFTHNGNAMGRGRTQIVVGCCGKKNITY